MDSRSAGLFLDDAQSEKLQTSLRRMGDFIAYFEIAEEKMERWKQNLDQTMVKNQVIIEQQLSEVKAATEELRGFMDEVGAARLSQRLQRYLEQGQEHAKTLHTLTEEHRESWKVAQQDLQKIAKKSFDRLDRASTYTVKNISEALNSFRISDFQRLTEQNCDAVQETSYAAIRQLKETVKWFHWKNLGLAFSIALFTSLVMGLYINDELPWETHKQVVIQRNAGKALMKVWPTLSENEQQRIIDHSDTALA